MEWTSTNDLLDGHVPGLDDYQPRHGSVRRDEPTWDDIKGTSFQFGQYGGGAESESQPRLAIDEDMDSVVTEPTPPDTNSDHTDHDDTATPPGEDHPASQPEPSEGDTPHDTHPVRVSASTPSDDGQTPWSSTPCHINGVTSQPAIRTIPPVILDELRRILTDAALKEADQTTSQVRDWVDRLSQTTLVIGCVLASLDVAIEVDATTRHVIDLYRRRTPLFDTILTRLDQLVATGHTQNQTTTRIRDELRDLRTTSRAIEQACAYTIADRSENFLRGSHDVHDAPITHRDALFVRDRIRQLVAAQHKLETERAGRPLR